MGDAFFFQSSAIGIWVEIGGRCGNAENFAMSKKGSGEKEKDEFHEMLRVIAGEEEVNETSQEAEKDNEDNPDDSVSVGESLILDAVNQRPESEAKGDRENRADDNDDNYFLSSYTSHGKFLSRGGGQRDDN